MIEHVKGAMQALAVLVELHKLCLLALDLLPVL